jgi:hypothetical protein
MQNSPNIESRATWPGGGEWMYLFRPKIAGTILYVKVIVRSNCIVISFHEDEGGGHEEEDQ